MFFLLLKGAKNMQVKPFKGILYNTNLVKLPDVVTPPYDKISSEKKDLYAEKSPYNMVHLILPSSYSKAASLTQTWLKNDILKQDTVPAIYIYEQEYEYPKGKTKVRRGFVGLLELKPFGKDTIMPHEQTFSKIKENRMQLLSTCKMNFGHIFILYSDPQKTVDQVLSEEIQKPPFIELKGESGITHRIWKITDLQSIKKIQEDMKDIPLFIADGHHRYGAALIYKEQEQEKLGDKFTGNEGFNYRMATFVNVENPGLTILPTHRVLKEVPVLKPEWLLGELEKYFLIEKINAPTNELLGSWFDSITCSKIPHTLGVYMGGSDYYTLKLKNNVSLENLLGISRPREWLYLDVNILHLLILKNIMDIDTHNAEEEANVLYIRDSYEAVDWVRNKGAGIAFILNPTKIEEVKKIVELGDVMPHKSTDFYPKLHTGLVMRKI